MSRAILALLCGTLDLLAASVALADGSQESTPHSQHSTSQSTAPSPPPEPNADETASETAHVPPDPPEHTMGDMPYREMAAMMQMDDRARTTMVLFDQLEWRNAAGGNAVAWDAQGWYGGDYNKIWVRSEGERVGGTTQDARADLLWDHTFARWWSVQAGGRQDFGTGPARTWAALGVQGRAPYWFETQATFYVGELGRTALRLKSEYELLLTQRLILQPEAEANLYGKADPARQLGSGLSDLEIGLRLRYEIRREFAPYIGIVWSRQFRGTADRVRETGGDPSDVQFVAGVRAWF
jgi:copper resistance protein B